MPKELPYFQFEPGQYITGNITLCSLPAQGLFINICAFYWQRACKVSSEQLHRKFDQQDLIQELFKEKIIKTKKERVSIHFLDKQYTALTSRKSKLSLAGLKGGLQAGLNKKKATPKHIEEKREEEKRENLNNSLIDTFFKDLENSSHIETIAVKNKCAKEKILSMIPKFKNHADLTYPDFNRFVNHFKNWVAIDLVKSMEQVKTNVYPKSFFDTKR